MNVGKNKIKLIVVVFFQINFKKIQLHTIRMILLNIIRSIVMIHNEKYEAQIVSSRQP